MAASPLNRPLKIDSLSDSLTSGRQCGIHAARWYRLAADQGDADAQFNLGAMYAEGQGVPQDYVTRSTTVVKDLAPWLSGLGHRLHGGTM